MSKSRIIVVTYEDKPEEAIQLDPEKEFPLFSRTFGWIDSEDDLKRLADTYDSYNVIIYGDNTDRKTSTNILNYTRLLKNQIISMIPQVSGFPQVFNWWNDEGDNDVVHFDLVSTTLFDGKGKECTIEWSPGKETDLQGDIELLEGFEDTIIQIGKENT